MKKFSELSMEEFTKIVNQSKKLREELDSYIQDCEMTWLKEKLFCVKSALSDYSIGFYNHNYMEVRDYDAFVNGVEKSVRSFGASERLEKLLNLCKKLRGSNLFEYYAKALKEVYYEDELKIIIDYTEDACEELCYGNVGEKSADYLECFFDAYDDYLYDEKSGIIYMPYKLSA